MSIEEYERVRITRYTHECQSLQLALEYPGMLVLRNWSVPKSFADSRNMALPLGSLLLLRPTLLLSGSDLCSGFGTNDVPFLGGRGASSQEGAGLL